VLFEAIEQKKAWETYLRSTTRDRSRGFADRTRSGASWRQSIGRCIQTNDG